MNGLLLSIADVNTRHYTSLICSQHLSYANMSQSME